MNRMVKATRRKRFVEAMCATAVLAFSAPGAVAQTATWGGGSGDWNSANWTWSPTGSGYPSGPTIDVVIEGTTGNLSTVTLDNVTVSVQDLSVDSYSTLTVQGQNLYVAGTSVTNSGLINVGVSGNSASLYLDESNVTLSGGGTVNLGDPNSYVRGYAGSENLVNSDNTIQGQGYIYSLASFTNNATVNANVSGGTLQIYGVATTNTGTLEATGGGTLHIYGTTVTNTGGTISTDGSSSVLIESSTIDGGNLSSTGGGVIHAISGTTLNDVTITTGTIYSIDGGNSTYLTSDLVNQGTIQVGRDGSASNLYLYETNANLTGGGTINLNDPNSYIRGYAGSENLTNTDNLIQGQGYIYGLASFTNKGTVDANVSGGTLYIYGVNTTNSGILEATNGGRLYIYGSTINDAGSTISTDSSSSLVLDSATINGGNLTSSGGVAIHAIDSTTLNDVTITTGTIYSIDGGNNGYLTSDLVNQGTIQVGRDGSASNLYLYETNVNLTGGGTINLNDSNSYFRGYAGSENLTNTDNVIQGQGYIYNLASFVNHGTVSANVEGGTLNIYGATTTTNSGTFQVSQGSTLAISYGSFTNSGTVNIGSSSDTSGSLFQMVGSNDYVQTAGTTTLGSAYSTLAVQSGQSVNIEGGLLQGFGTIQGNLINSGTVHPGDGPGTLTVTGNYTQNSGGVLDIAIGGLTPGSQYGVLSVTGSASLDGTLDISLLNGFTPTSGDTFVILTSSDLNGMFTDSTIQIGNVTFDVEYSPAGYANDVVLAAETSAVPEPASLVMLTVGLAGAGVVIARRRQVSQT